jgi:hypothetical protein
MNNVKQPLLRLKFEGSAIRDGRILFDDLSIFVSNISLAIERIINKLLSGESIRTGRPPSEIQVLSALEIVSVSKGSFQLALDLRRDGQQFPRWDLGEEATDLLIQGIEVMSEDVPLPEVYDQGVLMALREAGRIIERGVEEIHINSKSTYGRRRTTYIRPTREAIISRILRYEQKWATIEGRLLMADVKEDSLRCRLHPSTGMPILCQFDEKMTRQIAVNLRNFVRVRGEAICDTSTNRIISINIHDLEPISELTQEELPSIPISAYWSPKTYDELAIEQGVYPITDWEQLTRDWPEDTDFESFLEAVRSARQD